jgi:hypothetical protein
MTRKNNIDNYVILELWNEKLAAPGYNMQHRLNGKLYLINQDIYAQNSVGKLTYYIDIGLHDKNDERMANSASGPLFIPDRDWISLKFYLYDKDSVG